MKKQRHIRTRLTWTMIGLTSAVLIAVMLTFNIAVQSYIRSRISDSLDDVKEIISEDRRKGGPAPGEKKDGHWPSSDLIGYPEIHLKAENSALGLC